MDIDQLAGEIIEDLDEYAREYDPYEYGLPTDDLHKNKMREIVKEKLKKLINK